MGESRTLSPMKLSSLIRMKIRSVSLEMRIRHRYLGWVLFILPAGAVLTILLLWPLVDVVWTSFQARNMLNLDRRGFVGLANFGSFFSDSLWWLALKNGLIWTVGSVAGEFFVGLGSALLLNQNLRGRVIFRSLVLIPWIVPIVVASILWRWMLNPDFGIVNVLLVKSGILESPVYWLGEVNTALYSCIFVNIWRSFPFYTIVFLAALRSIPPEETEAALIDGANSFQRFIYIMIPHLRYVSLVVIVLHVMWTFYHFDFVWLLTGGGPLNASEILPTLIYRTAFRYYDFGVASAMSVMMTVILGMLIFTYFKLIGGGSR